MAQQILSTNTFTTAKWIVSANASDGTHTTIGAALTSASSGDTIFIRPGTYTENLTLKAGVNLTAFGSDSSLNQTGKVIISGKATFTAAGSVTISGIQLQTNSDFALAVTGSAASIVNLQNCNLNATNNTAISFTVSNTAAIVNLNNCTGDLGTTGIAIFSSSSTGNINLNYCNITNSGGSSTANTCSAGVANIYFCNLTNPLTTSSTGGFKLDFSQVSTIAQNVTTINANGSGSQGIGSCYLFAGSASCITIGTGASLSITYSSIGSSNTNAITGLGSITYYGLVFNNSSSLINTTTQSGGLLQGGQSQAPSAGLIGERIESTASAASVSLSSGIAKTITSINLTAGIWDIVGMIEYSGASGSCQATHCTIGTSTNTLGTSCNNDFQGTLALNGTYDAIASVPSYRQTLTTSTTIYLVGQCAITAGTISAGGRISATRVG